MKMVIFFAALALAACSQTPPPEPIVRTVEVKVAVPQPCKALTELGVEPAYPDGDAALKAAPDLFERVKLLLQGRLLRQARLAQYQAARASC